MSKRRIRRKRRARVKILPLILVGAVIAGVITVIMSVNLKGADKEPPTEEIYITETLQAPQAENTEPVTKTEQEAKLEHDLNYTYPYNTMSADWGSEVYEDGFRYYEILQEYKDAGGCFPEIVQVYLWCECKEYGVDYYTVLAIIERESGYHWDKVGDNGNSKGYMQIYEKWHTERMEAEGVTDLFNPYQNIRVGLNCLREIQDKYLASSGENCVLMVYNMGESTAKKLWAKDIYSSAYSREVIARAQELRQELTQE